MANQKTMVREIRKEFNALTKGMTEWLRINEGWGIPKDVDLENSLRFLKRAAAIVKHNMDTIEILMKNQ